MLLGARSVPCLFLLFVVIQGSLDSYDRGARFTSARSERFLARNSSRLWKTLSGKAPLVIARGGLSGLFPDYTVPAYAVAMNNSLLDTALFCDLQLTKDGQGICRTDLRLDNSTNIADLFKNHKTSYIVNGMNITGWFSIDFTAEQILSKVLAKQPFSSRTDIFDGLSVLPVEGVNSLNPAALWVNVQYSEFYEQHKLSMSSYVLSTAKTIILDYVSSPEVAFLRRVRLGFRRSRTKLVLRFLNKETIEPSTNQTYGSLLRNLTFVKSFASGILVPKDYIWPLHDDLYLLPHTSLVQDAHKAGLEVYASDFANDAFSMSYNYSYDPVREYIQFVDNPDFAVDGVLTDFSVTASEAIACYAHNKKNTSSSPGKPLIISRNGASGDYPGCTDLAYQVAVQDGVDYIDCSVQMTKDGTAICRESPDLIEGTNVLTDSSFYPARLARVSEIKKDEGIFTFDLTWKEIQGLKPQIYSPFGGEGYNLLRNPAYQERGKFMTLSDFLEFAKEAKVGALIDIQNARYLASKQRLDATNAVLTELKKAGYENMTRQVMIQSDDSAVLHKFKDQPHLNLVYQVEAPDVSVPDSTIKEIKEFADTVTLYRSVIFPTSDYFLMNTTDLVSRMHDHNLTVFVFRLRNEFPALAFDYLSDPTMEINTYVQVAKVDGLITEFPATAKAYLSNACLHPKKQTDYSMFLVEPGALLAAIPPQRLPPPAPAPTFSAVVDAPLPAVSPVAPAPASLGSAPATSSPSGQPSTACHFTLSLLFGLFITLILICD
eukprot:Gb_18319 [translate_table: standard]